MKSKVCSVTLLSVISAFCATSALRAQTGTYTTIDPGTGNTLTITSDTSIGGALDVTGNLLQFGNATGTTSQPAIVLKYTDDATGATSTLELQSARSAATWKWEASIPSVGVQSTMVLDATNTLNIYPPYDSNNPTNSATPAIVVSPGTSSTSPTISIGGQQVATTASLSSGYIPLVSGGLTVTSNGFVGIGTTTPTAQLDLALGSTSIGLLIGGDQNTTGTSYASYMANWDAGPAVDSNTPKGVFGSVAQGAVIWDGVADSVTGLFASALNFSNGTPVNTVTGGEFSVANWGGSASATVQNMMGIHILYPTVGTGSGVVVNSYQLYIDESAAGQNNYSIYAVGGVNYFGGSVGIGTATPLAPLHVSGAARFDGAVRIAPQGDIGMGVFTNEPSN